MIRKNRLSPFLTVCMLFACTPFLGQLAHDVIYDYVGIVFPFVLLLFFVKRRNNRKINSKLVGLSIGAILSILLSFIIVGGGLGSVIGNIGFVVFFFVFYHVRFGDLEFEHYVRLLGVFQVYLVIAAIFSGYVGWGSASSEEAYFMGNNPNTLGTQCVINFAFFFLMPIKNKFKQIFLLSSSVLLLVMSGTRTCMFVLLVFLFLFYISRNKVWKFGWIKVFCFSLMVLGILFPLFYSVIFPEMAVIDALTEYSVENFDKQVFSGREVIWGGAWNQLLSSPLNFMFGIGSHFYINNSYSYFGSDFEMNSNFHSAFFSLFICCGLVGYVLLMNLYAKLVLTKRILSNGKRSDMNVYFLPFMIIGLSESTLFGGSIGIQLFIMLSMLLNSEKVLERVKKC